MDFSRLKKLLAFNGGRIRALVEGTPVEQARWRPDAASWSILEVINHLYDEERSDFRVRLEIILHSPDQPFPPINPQGWVEERGYNARDLAASLEDFLAERRASLAWLGQLSEPDWEQTAQAPFGPVSAGEMFAAWVAHDTLHMRQLVELHHAYVMRLVGKYSTAYAGEW